MSKLTATRLLAAAVVVVSAPVLQGCIVIRDSPAPGCVERAGISPMGGCLGKTAIVDLEVEPEIGCLSITVNNCNGGILEARNECEQAVVLGGVRIESQESVRLDVVAKGDERALARVSSNFSSYVPAEDDRIELVGAVGQRQVKVTFTKTAKLCE